MAFCCGYSQCNTGLNLAMNKTAVASSLENAAYTAAGAFDGNTVSRWSSAYNDNEYIHVDLGSIYPLCQVVLSWEAAYGRNFTIDISSNASTWTTAATITGNTVLTNTISISGSARYVRMKGSLRGTGYGYSLYEFQVFSTSISPSCPAANIASNKAGVISSLENAIYPAANAFDGNPATRWSSAFSDPQSIFVDLGTQYALCGVDLTWEAAYGVNYEIDGSNNAITWTTLATIIGNTTLSNSISVAGSYRYVRMLGTARATGYGYSLFDFAVHGAATLPVEISGFSGVPQSNGEINLNWSAPVQERPGTFIIQRSGDAMMFDSVGAVNAHADSRAGSAYHYSDATPGPGIYYYRLKQIDPDGQVAFSSIIRLQVESGNDPTLFLSPNPAGSWFTLKGKGIKENAELRITDLRGNLVRQLAQVSPAEAVSVAGLPPGLYFVSVRTASRSNTLKLIKH